MAIQLVHFDGQDGYPLLGLWQVTESTDELRVLLPPVWFESAVFDAISLEKRRREWLTARILLHHLRPLAILDFRPNGKPFLRNGEHVSISHSGNLAGVIIHKSPVGLDIQPEDEKLFRIRGKFCHPEELAMIEGADAISKLAIIWSAKEAVFKVYGEGIFFASDMRLLPFDAGDEKLRLRYEGGHGKRTFELIHRYIFNFHVVHTI